MYSSYNNTAEYDPQLMQAVTAEQTRQEEHIELIASENYTSPRVLEMQGSVLTNKYAEGYPGKRYYGGCEFVDQAESLAIERAKQLFGADYVNVQPHSGSQANAAAFAAMLQPGDVILGMDLSNGGHLTHGAKVNFSGKIYTSYSYGLDEDGVLDYDQVERLAKEHKPKLLITGFSAYSGVMDWQRLRDIADSVGAYMLSDIAHVAGLVAAGVYPSPVGIADVTTTTTHKTLRGPRSGLIMAKANPELEKKLNSAVFPGNQGGPLMHVIAAKAVSFKEALEPGFKVYAQQVVTNAQAMVDVFLARGFKVVSGGTHNHLFLLDLIGHDLSGKQAEHCLESAHITTNKNSVPGDPRSPFVTSGLRLGSAAATTRGFGEVEMRDLTHWICDILDSSGDAAVITEVRSKVSSLCKRFPVYNKRESLV
jgi:glycine hydroxymethyltransferase